MAVSHTLLGIVEADELIDLPVESDPGDVYLPLDAEVKLHGNTLPAFIPGLQAGLIAESATLESGKAVETAADVVTWCLEQLQAAVS